MVPQEMDAISILERAVFEYIVSIEDEFDRTELAERFADRAKTLGVKAKFDNMFKAMIKQKKQEAKQLQLEKQKENKAQGQNYTMFDCDYPQLYCGGWTATDHGVVTYSMFGECVACYHPILPVKRLVNIGTNTEKMVIAFNKLGFWQEHVFEKSTIMSSAKIVTEMANCGVLVSSETAKWLVKYLLEVEAFNLDQIPTEKSTSKMGWMDNFDSFMPYMSNGVSFDSESSFQGLYKSMEAKGNKQEYMELLRGIRKHKRKEPMMCVAAALASVLVKPLGTLPFIFHLYGEAGKGKTISLMLASSVWGSPDENGYMSDPKSTKIAFEMRLNFLNNLPFICDDMAQIKKTMTAQRNGDFSDFIYLVCSGKGNERSNVKLGLSSQTTWRNSSITSGEKPITSDVSQGGEILRVVEYQTDPGNIFEDSKGTAEFLRNNYGFLGRTFLKLIQTVGIDKIKEVYNRFIGIIQERDVSVEKEGKQVNAVALMLTADRLLSEFVFKDDVYLDFDMVYDLIKSNKQMSDNERAYEFVMNEVSMHRRRFETTSFEPDQRWGYFKDEYVLINPNVFSTFADQGNFDKRMFVKWAKENDLAKTNKDRIDWRPGGKMSGTFIAIKLPEEPVAVEVEDGKGEEDKF